MAKFHRSTLLKVRSHFRIHPPKKWDLILPSHTSNPPTKYNLSFPFCNLKHCGESPFHNLRHCDKSPFHNLKHCGKSPFHTLKHCGKSHSRNLKHCCKPSKTHSSHNLRNHLFHNLKHYDKPSKTHYHNLLHCAVAIYVISRKKSEIERWGLTLEYLLKKGEISLLHTSLHIHIFAFPQFDKLLWNAFP